MGPILLRSIRGEGTEAVRRGHVVVSDGDGAIVSSLGDPDHATFLRSSAKPIQVLPFVEAGGLEYYGLEEKHLAIMVASHHGQEFHIESVQEIMERVGLDEEMLRCAPHAPSHEPSRDAVIRAGGHFRQIHNNCSGKHTGMLAFAKMNRWSLEDYVEPDHPVQRAVRAALEDLGGHRFHDRDVAIDGCGIPTYHGPLRILATSFARLSATNPGEARSQCMVRIRSAMCTYPELVAGEGGADTMVMGEATEEKIFTKVGAMGLFGIGLPQRGLGVAIKLEDGNLGGMALVARHVLRSLGVPPWAGDGVTSAPIRNWAGRLVGEEIADFELPMANAGRSITAA